MEFFAKRPNPNPNPNPDSADSLPISAYPHFVYPVPLLTARVHAAAARLTEP
jgi:hypothetical protein